MDEVKDIHLNEISIPRVVSLNYNSSIYGTGFHIKYKGGYYILTNRHVCDWIQEVAKWSKTNETTDILSVNGEWNQEIIARDDKHDLCLLEGFKKTGFDLAQSYHSGEKVTLIGHPRGLPLTVREGRVMDCFVDSFPWVSKLRNVRYCRVSTIGYGGNSGSPVLNRWGNLVGVFFAGYPSYHTEGFMIPLPDVRDFLKRSLD